MRAKRFLSAAFCALVIFLACSGALQPQSGSSPALKSPPIAPVRPVIDDYHGTKVSDPYRYMENLQDPEVQAWFKAQNDYTRAVLGTIPGRQKLLVRLTQLDQSVPLIFARRLPADVYLIEKRLPNENLARLYRRKGLSGDDVLLLDPDKIALRGSIQGKGKNSVLGQSPSNDSKYDAVCVAPGGSELDGELHLIDFSTGQETGDVIPRVGAEAWTPYWLPDNKSFVYGRLQTLPPGAPESEVRQKFRSYLHVLGTDPAQDKPVFGYGVVSSVDVDPSLIASIQTQPGSKYALGLLNGSVTPNSAYYIAPIDAIGKSNDQWRKIADLSDGVTDIAIHGNDLYILTYKNAPRYKVLRTNASKPDLASAETIVPPGEAVIEGIYPAQDALYARVLDGGIGRLLRVTYGPNPKVEHIALPFDGSIFMTAPDPRVPGVLFYATSWTKSGGYYAYNPTTREVADTKLQPVGPFDHPASIESVEVKAKSYDGTDVPLSIIHGKDLKLDGANPTLLEGYGSYGSAYPPNFDPTMLAWYEQGTVYAVCHVRGGGEYGEEWHLAGKGPTKSNTWRDFIACAQYLIDHKYTSPAHLAGMGVSAGGILIGRAITERPDLFAVAIDKVGSSDTLRAETTQNGETNIPEFGTAKTEAGFKALYAMSAYYHVENGTRYPAVLLETGMNDPRTAPWEMAKMTARLEAATSSGKPVLLRVEYQGGHGGMNATLDQLRQYRADEWSFLLWQLGSPDFQPPRNRSIP